MKKITLRFEDYNHLFFVIFVYINSFAHLKLASSLFVNKIQLPYT